MAVHLIRPTCPDPIHKRAEGNPRKISPVVAIVRLRGFGGRWAPRCRSCLNRLRLQHTDYDIAYLHGHHPAANHDVVPEADPDRPTTDDPA